MCAREKGSPHRRAGPSSSVTPLTLPAPAARLAARPRRTLYTTISDNITVTDANTNLVVESLRSIAEIVIWG